MSATYNWVRQFPLEWQKPPQAPPPPATVEREDVRSLRASISAVLARKIVTATELQRDLAKEERPFIATYLPGIDELLGGVQQKGKLTDLVSHRSSGRFAAVLAALASATQSGEVAALVDAGDGLDPQIAAAWRIDLSRMLWVRPCSLKHAVMSAEMLISTGFPLVALDLGVRLRGRRPDEAAWVRLARSAEKHGAALVVSSPFPVSGTASDAVVMMMNSRSQWQGRGKSPRLLVGVDTSLTLEKHRGGKRPGTTASLHLTSPDARGKT
jgi:hypothetical protein